ncbi:hypothetical protein QAD02_013542 [Eretmocerus hayati]|uniref:Uncharacterized protein n=1 Tax=Eretmocerus hayati TaxID=131215 RepID=A0ACC2P2F7_9HYME|nr:hypothetical protein QAD02_013542 [Eretmocerus hayati]
MDTKRVVELNIFGTTTLFHVVPDDLRFPGSGISGARYLQAALATLDFDERVPTTYVFTVPLSLECTHPLLPVEPLDPSLLGIQGSPTESVSDVSDQESLDDIEDYGYPGSGAESDCSSIPDWNYGEVSQFHILEQTSDLEIDDELLGLDPEFVVVSRIFPYPPTECLELPSS